MIMEYYYKNGITDVPAKITVIQTSEKGKRSEIIRDKDIGGRTVFAGFWVNTSELIER